MRVIRSPEAMRRLSERWRRAGLGVGFVPTMGALHEGHLSLVRASRAAADRTVVSIFVNPLQFGPGEDFRTYPRPAAADRRLLASAGVHALFAPSARGLYPRGFATSVEVGGSLTAGLCARVRPGHFRGVATVVAKLLLAVRPHLVVVGRKDAQQVLVIRRMVRDLGLDVRVLDRATVREPDGLAMSSRNRRLAPAERRAAPALHRALAAGAAAVRAGERNAGRVLAAARRVLGAEPRLRVQYLAIVDPRTLLPVRRVRGPVLLAAAAFLGRTRLIDNVPARPR